MEIKNLRYFLAVAREENMSHAAEILHVTQPTLSKALKSLEDNKIPCTNVCLKYCFGIAGIDRSQ